VTGPMVAAGARVSSALRVLERESVSVSVSLFESESVSVSMSMSVLVCASSQR